jgi:hypothetical protein
MMGSALGLIGTGGAILAVPALVYIFGYSALNATTASLVIVITTASVSVIHYSETGSAVSKLNDTGSEWLTKLNEEAVKTPTLGGESGSE